ncbi:General transcription factor II-I repeat domain-containing protein 2 [Merluccius polli]|uniref:General transcription factor II-I repeat domain-containing protein 2 n=1 Tax=Merluccius polli TaxID=89951 RepID=A0AA47NAW8_MERPO|nr:General transcription factor II-I repeat domain-containing protein 2 [Merluccius polli]
MSESKKKKTYHFQEEWEEEFFFTTVRDKSVCLICGAAVALAKRHNVERHFSTLHRTFNASYPPGSTLRAEKVRELKAALGKQQSFFTKPVKQSVATTEASFRAAQYLAVNKKAFSDGEVVKGVMSVVADTLFKDHKNGKEIIAAISDVQLSANTIARRVSAMSTDLTQQLNRELGTCKWFSIQCDESVDNSSTAQLMVFVRMVFSDFTTKEEMLTLLPLKTTTKAVDIYEAMKRYFTEKNIPLEKLVSVTTDGAPAMTGRHSGFIARCRRDPDFPRFLNYHCIIHQQAICAKVMGFDHVMTPVVKIVNSIRSKATQHRSFKLLLEELSAEYGDLLLHTEIRWLSRGRVLQRFLSLLGEIKEFMDSRGQDTALLQDAEWKLDLAFLTDITGKLNHLNCELQGKDKNVTDMISAVSAFRAKLNIFSVHLQINSKRYCSCIWGLGQGCRKVHPAHI